MPHHFNASNRQIKPFHLDIDDNDRLFLHQSLDRILDSGTLILGSYTESFEKQFAEYVGAKYAVSVNSATSALEIQLRLENVRGRRVAVPTNTNFATAAAVLHAGGELAFMDMDASTFMPSLQQLQEAKDRYPDLAGVVWVHIGGVIPPDMLQIARFCQAHGLFLIEDCAHAHGSRLGGMHAGSFGKSGAFSFFPTKVMTTMEGGMVTTDDADYAAAVKSYRNQGKRVGNYNALHYDLGSSWRLSEFGAAFGLAQLAKLDQMIERRAIVADAYVQAFKRLAWEYVDTAYMDRCSNYKVIGILPDHISLQQAKTFMAQRGIVLGGGVYEVPLHAQPVFADRLRPDDSFPVADRLCHRQICLPITSGMSRVDALEVVEALDQLAGA